MPVQIADVIIVKDDLVLLVQQRKKLAYGLWSFPGGHVDAGETAEQAVVREVQEELGAQLQHARFLKTFQIASTEGPLEIHSFIGVISNDVHLKRDELLGYGWFSLEALETMKDKLRAPVVLEQAKDAIALHS